MTKNNMTPVTVMRTYTVLIRLTLQNFLVEYFDLKKEKKTERKK